MLKDHPERACMFFAAEYLPEVAFTKRVPDAAEAIQAKLKTPTWGTTSTNGYFFRVPAKRQFFTIDWQRLIAQAIGLLNWQTDLNDYGAAFRLALEAMGVRFLKRVGFKVWAFLPTGMSHAEMVDLMYGSFLAPAQDLESICGKPEDALAQLHGSRGNMKVQVVVAPMNADQASLQVGTIPNLEHFVEPKHFDTGLKEFRDRVTGNCLFVDIDLHRLNYNYNDVASFMKESFTVADTVAAAAVQRLTNLRAKKGGR